MRNAFKSLLLAFTTLCAGVVAYAQVTTSALSGRVVDQTGQPVVGAAILAQHEPSGTVYGAITNADGRYTIQGMRTGGPYNVEFSCLGYQQTNYTGVVLQLAETYNLNAQIAESTEFLSEAVVVAQPASKFSVEKTGAATNISNAQIAALPTVSRAITDVTKLSPYGGNGMQFAGSDGRTANFTVDGANFNNNFGLSDKLPGGGSPISIDAIEEVQIVISPFDVRQTNFIGGGLNAITKSGTNTLKGTAYVYHTNENMRGNAIEGDEISGARDKDRTTTYGFTLGGPIIKNKLFFFANFEKSVVPTVVNRWRPSDDGKANPDAYISRTTKEDMQKVADFLAASPYNYDAGSYTDYPANESNTKILARLDWNITDKHHLALRYNYTLNRGWNNTNGSSSNATQRAVQNRLSQYSMAFANAMYSMDNKVNTFSLDFNSRLSNSLSNQFLATYSMLDDIRGTNSAKFPFIDILDGTNTYTPYMAVGYELFTWNNGVHNRVFTAKDDLTYYFGDHKLTAGLSYEYQMADNSYMRNGTGYYRYNSLNDFLTGAMPETVALTYGYDGELNPAARVRFHKAALYAQDEWNPNEKLKVTAGLRIEGLIFDNHDLMTNNKILAQTYYNHGEESHIDTGKWPTSKVQVSPRLGFTYDVFGDKSLKVRGGTGLFSGRLPLVFFTNMPTNSGMVQNVSAVSQNSTKIENRFDILGKFAGNMVTDVPTMLKTLNEADPDRFPLTISPEKGVLPTSIAAVDPKFKMPQVWKTSLAVDYSFPTSFPLSISAEAILNKTVNAVCIRDYNMMDVNGFARFNGPDKRHIYPSVYTYTSTSAYVLTNTNKGYGAQASVTVNARPWDGIDFTAAYTHSVSKELTGMPGSDANSAFTYIPTVDGPNNVTLHNSQYVTPDRFFASLSINDKSNNMFSFFYETWRGGYNYSYMYANDMNGDNYNYDAIYIPKEINELEFASWDDKSRFWEFMTKVDPKNLFDKRGTYAEGYSVYSPWVHRLDFRYTHDFKIKLGKTTNTLQVNFDVKNILNLFNSSWGVSKQMNPELNSGRILKMEGVNADGVPVFSTPKAVSGTTQLWTLYHDIHQCWYAQIGIKYLFN